MEINITPLTMPIIEHKATKAPISPADQARANTVITGRLTIFPMVNLALSAANQA